MRRWCVTWVLASGLVVGAAGGGEAQDVSALLAGAAYAEQEAIYLRCGRCVVRDEAEAERRGPATPWPVLTLAPESLRGVAVVEGTIAALETRETGTGRVFTVARLDVQQVRRASTLASIAASASVVVTQPGGTVDREGRRRTVRVAPFEPWQVGATVEVMMLPVGASGTFQQVSLPPAADALARAEGVR